MKKLLIALLLTFSMSVSLAACGGENSSSDNSSPNDSSIMDSSGEQQDSSSGGSSSDNTSSDGDNEDEKKETVTVTFKQNLCADIVKTVEKGSALLDIPTPQGKTGYTVSWDTTDFSTITSDLVVNAVEVANTYTITYDAEGYAIDGTTVTLVYDAACASLDMTLTSDENDFLGWKYGNVTYTKDSIWNIADNVTLTADWVNKNQAVVSFVDTDGTTINKTVMNGESLTDIPTPKQKTGYIVDTQNWYEDEACTTLATFTDIQESKTVYAKATAKSFTLKLNAAGGELSVTTITVTYDESYSLETPTYEEYTFAGWVYNGKTISLEGIWSLDVDGNEIELTAKWNKQWTGFY